jgi:predicted DNA-binding protein with PD1-like motif
MLFSISMRVVFILILLLMSGQAARAQTAPSSASMSVPVAQPSAMRTYALRLRPGDDLRQQLLAFVAQHHLKAATVLTCVGSLTTATLRLANQSGPTVYQGHFEIVSLVGTLSVNGSHLHLAFADSTGRTVGGHLLDGNRIYTTAELVLGVLDDVDFRRETDPVSTYQELVVYPVKPSGKKRASPKK